MSSFFSESRGMNREVLRLAVPSIVSNITVPLLSLVDIAIAGHMGNALFLAAIGVGSMVFNIIYWLFGFLRMGGSGLTAQAFGAADNELIRFLHRRTLALALLFGVALIVLAWPLREFALLLMQTDGEVLPHAREYFNICIFGAPAVLGSFALNGWMIGMQNTRIPALVAVGQNIINIVLSALFVLVFHLSLPGIALGTLLAQWSAFLLLLLLSLRLLPKKSEDRREGRGAVSLFSVNRNIFLRTLCLVAVNLYFTSASSAQGALILAANTLLMTFFTLFSYFMDGFAYAAEALAGRLYAAPSHLPASSRLRPLESSLLFFSALLVVVFTASYLFGSRFFISLLTDSPEVCLTAASYSVWTLFIPVAGVWAFAYDGLFIGLTRTREMLLSSFAGAVLFFLIILLLTPTLANHALWLALLAYLLVRGVILKMAFRKNIP